ncbi:MAG: ABC transporter substrate-binding protein [Fusobacterium sp. JB020]|nr:ABC transporter substrate-binding protein [Fusobacterium sp. JB020]
MKKVMILVIASLFMFGCGKKQEKINIGITQIIEHPALDAATEGFKEALADGGYTEDKVNIEVQNAQGDFGVAQTIASSFVQDKKDLILAVSTPSAQSVFNVTKEIPLLITAVTDPVAVGLVGDNITGTSDMAPIDKQIQLMKALLPNAKRIGFLYNTSEENSRVFLKKMKEIAEPQGFEIVEKGVTNINEVGQAIDVLLDEIDVLYTPSDNVVTASMSLISNRAEGKNIPVITSDGAQFEAGALATEAIDFKKLGYQTGKMAVRVLNGEKPSDMPIETLKDTELMINEEMAKKFNVIIPKELKNKLN